MAWGAGASAWNGLVSGTTVTTGGVTTQATGSTFIIFAQNRNSMTGVLPTTITDSFSNSYTLGPTVTYGGGVSELALYYCINGSGGASHTATCTWTGTQTVLGVGFAEFTGGGNGALDQSPTGTQAFSVLTLAAPTLTSANGKLVVSAFATFGGNSQTITDSGAGFTILVDQLGSSMLNGAISYAFPSSSGTYGDTFTWTVSDSCAALSLSIAPTGPALLGQILT